MTLALPGHGNTAHSAAQPFRLWFGPLTTSRASVGNYLVFWRKDHAGYTTDIDDAHEFTLAEALSHRQSDVPWSVEEMQTKARLRVDHQLLAYSYKEQRELMVKQHKNGPEKEPV